MTKIQIYDTTLRDGSQAEAVSFTLEDKIRITNRLDHFGIDFVEGGWPGSNPKDMAFFKEIKNSNLKNARVAAFGSTHNPKESPENDPNLQAMVKAGTEVMAIVGKSWDVHVRDALRISLEKNLEIIRNSMAFLSPETDLLLFDAEHFFDGYKHNREYAIETLKAAHEGGADYFILCDTTGGALPHQISESVREVKKLFPEVPLGIHTHNDGELAVANSLAAVEAGAIHVQGTINGLGERCGNANLCSVIPALILKMGYSCLIEDGLLQLSEVSRLVSELANIQPNSYQPYVGRSAFAHKGGIHISAVKRNPETYEHIRPDSVGNVQRILISDLAGKGAILHKAQEYGLDIDSQDPVVMQIVQELKDMEAQGFQFDGAEGSFELLMNRAMGTDKKYFELLTFRVIDQKPEEDEPPVAEATIMVKVGGKIEHTAAVGNGPVNALDNAIRKALERFYPELAQMSLIDYKVRVLPSTTPGTGAKVRVLIESGDQDGEWGTVGVSYDIIEASWQALVDSVNYKLYRDERKKK